MRAYAGYYTHTAPLRRGPVFAAYRACFYALNALVVALGGQWSGKRALARMYLQDAAPGRLLDVGAGSGKFLYEMRGRGWEVEGLDADPQAAKAAGERYGVRVRACGLAEARFPSCSFDAITLNHVLEHLPDPVALLRECERVLRPGGRLVGITPNADSWGHGRFGRNWRGLEPPRHLHVFNPRSLAACAGKAGFARFDLNTNAGSSWPMLYESLLLESSGAYTIGTSDRPKALALRALLLEFQECRLLKSKPDAGEVCVLVCDKPASSRGIA